MDESVAIGPIISARGNHTWVGESRCVRGEEPMWIPLLVEQPPYFNSCLRRGALFRSPLRGLFAAVQLMNDQISELERDVP
jgi:hypothetical protein